MYMYNRLYYNLSTCIFLSITGHNKLFLIKFVIFKNYNKVDL